MIKLKEILLEFIGKKIIYFAHPREIYDTPVEKDWMNKLRKQFPEYVIDNPNQPNHLKHVSKEGEIYYLNLIKHYDAVIALPLAKNIISNGTSIEIKYGFKIGIPVFIINLETKKFERIYPNDFKRFKIMSNNDTEARLIRQNKIHLLDPVLEPTMESIFNLDNTKYIINELNKNTRNVRRYYKRHPAKVKAHLRKTQDDRVARNRARRHAIAKHGKTYMKNKDVHHVHGTKSEKTRIVKKDHGPDKKK